MKKNNNNADIFLDVAVLKHAFAIRRLRTIKFSFL